ncbi:lipoate--protein ligase family protein [Nitrospina gracilis]|uniref:lipoate--protein ligase family protein n=1 Tax=Nitrospina gracilis TaxID=35801 RepID=UPI001F47B1C8|nr:lipoate-protein ligase A [Nitrospina gracilis Nb-211]
MNRWRYIEDDKQDGGWNMAVDEALLRTCERDASFVPTLRLYGWKRPTLSIGYSQPVEAEIDLERCREKKVDWVRRPTGGRALLHMEELTYSMVGPVTHPLFSGGLKATFSVISQALLQGLVELNIGDAHINREKQYGTTRQERSPACFASLNHCEITVRERKLIGSAQRRTQQAFLQHGSVLIATDHDLFHSLLIYRDGVAVNESLAKLKASTTTLNEIAGSAVAFEAVRDAFHMGMTAHFDGAWTTAGLTAAERDLAEHLLERSRTIAGTVG